MRADRRVVVLVSVSLCLCGGAVLVKLGVVALVLSRGEELPPVSAGEGQSVQPNARTKGDERAHASRAPLRTAGSGDW